jgi:hypothetical protein
MTVHQLSSTINSFNAFPDLLGLVERYALVFGTDHFETLSCRQDLARIHLVREEFPEARKYLEPLYKKGIETLGPTSRITQSVANDLAICANMQEEYDHAESILYNSFPELQKAAAEQLEIDIFGLNPWTFHAMSILAAVFGARNEDHRSEIIHQRVIDGLMAQDGQKSRVLYESVINKGQAIRDQFRYREARKHYHEWLIRCDQNLGPESEESCEMRRRLVELDQREKKWKEVSQSLKPPEMQGLATWMKFSGSITAVIASVLAVALAAWMYFIWISGN